MREIGINLEIVPVEWADWLSKVFTDKDFDMTIVSHTEANDIDIYGRPGYYFQYENPEFNKLMAELKVTNDDSQAQGNPRLRAEDPGA